ncbi:indole-3-glycerol phosphate synthase TrpC [Poritiphilus flavus]|uniref:Indole-3-glycerol phosphate synthase n=1 Tax=Poritiphilus flavus TaxID=2697053 RepID=A0A6L9EAR7_9FLAO|nr:indole-3-glycerol phosphate synthase TrpC [Poritiphilus flavus]NAS11790.1 indole-3-glycerol phosphate synthase TrpC [Poritiphilus flavus]
MNILERIVRDKRKEVDLKKELTPVSLLERFPLFERKTNSLAEKLKQVGSSGIIAEHKRRSPSRSVINQSLSVQEVALGYQNAGVAGMSVLTDLKYFGGSLEDVLSVRASVQLPILRKEFIIDPFQILEAKAYGADVILLIAAILSRSEIKSLSETAKDLGLDVLLEVHNEAELQKSLMPSLDMLGVNNRDLKTFEVSLDTSRSLSEQIPDDFVKVSESGISNVDAIQDLRSYGYKGFLVGEHFMKTENPGKKASEFIKALNS